MWLGRYHHHFHRTAVTIDNLEDDNYGKLLVKDMLEKEIKVSPAEKDEKDLAVAMDNVEATGTNAAEEAAIDNDNHDINDDDDDADISGLYLNHRATATWIYYHGTGKHCGLVFYRSCGNN